VDNIALYKNMMRIAIEKGQDIDLIKTTKMNNQFDFIDPNEFRDISKMLIVGIANIENIEKILEQCEESTEIIILEDDKRYIDLFEERITSLRNNIKIRLCNLENMMLDNDELNKIIRENPISNAEHYFELLKKIDRSKHNNPLITYDSLDTVCINLYNRYDKKIAYKLMEQSFKLLKEYGKLIVNLVLSDELLNKNVSVLYENVEVKHIPQESEMFTKFESLGYLASSYIWRGKLPTNIVNKVELRPFTIKAMKGVQGICKEKGHAVLYKGPWKEVVDDDGHVLKRGERIAVCEKTFRNLTSKCYKNQICGIQPYYEIEEEKAQVFDCSIAPIRDPKVTKGIKKLKDNDSVDINEIKCC